MKSIIIQLLASTVLVLVLAHFIDGVEVTGFVGALITSVVLGLLNLIVKPILKIVSFPITIITLGLFSFVINAIIVKVCDHFVDDFAITGWLNVFIFSILLSIGQSIIGYFVKE
jgi:putative membrane protein